MDAALEVGRLSALLAVAMASCLLVACLGDWRSRLGYRANDVHRLVLRSLVAALLLILLSMSASHVH